MDLEDVKQIATTTTIKPAEAARPMADDAGRRWRRSLPVDRPDYTREDQLITTALRSASVSLSVPGVQYKQVPTAPDPSLAWWGYTA